MRHVLTEVVGVRPDLLPKVAVHDIKSGDVLLLASDGLHGVLSVEALQTGLQAETTPGAIAEHLVRQAVASGATDNVTALVVRVRR
jgi:serine/threonine protein phosphatase PrpC